MLNFYLGCPSPNLKVCILAYLVLNCVCLPIVLISLENQISSKMWDTTILQSHDDLFATHILKWKEMTSQLAVFPTDISSMSFQSIAYLS